MIEELMNPWIRNLVPYSSARNEFSGNADVFLDANESWEGFDEGVNRYPDPSASLLRRKIEEVMGFPYQMTGIGNGSDEIIDILIRIFCRPEKDKIMIERPTYGTYSVFANTSGVGVVDVPLLPSLDLDVESVIDMVKKEKPKIVFICSPNNPTGRVYPLSEVKKIADENEGITVVDEAYADFAEDFESAFSLIAGNPRVCVLRTFSKAYGAAGARLGILIASREIQKVFSKVKPPYNISYPSLLAGMKALDGKKSVDKRIGEVRERRKDLSSFLSKLPYVRKVFPSSANFVLVRTLDASALYEYLLSKGIVVRNRSSEPLLENTLRITIGSESEMDGLKEALCEWKDY